MGVSNLNTMFHDILGATDLAGMSAGKKVLAEDFTYADEFDEYEERYQTTAILQAHSTHTSLRPLLSSACYDTVRTTLRHF